MARASVNRAGQRWRGARAGSQRPQPLRARLAQAKNRLPRGPCQYLNRLLERRRHDSALPGRYERGGLEDDFHRISDVRLVGKVGHNLLRIWHQRLQLVGEFAEDFEARFGVELLAAE